MPTLLAFVSMLGGNPAKALEKTHPLLEATSSAANDGDEATASLDKPRRPIEAHGVRLLELTDRSSSVMKVSELDSYTAHDPIVNTFRTFGRLHNLAVSGEVTVLPESSFADALVTRASDNSSDFVLLPWTETGTLSEKGTIDDNSVSNKLATSSYVSFVQSTFENARCTTGVFINKNFGGSNTGRERNKLRRTFSAHSIRSHKDKEVAAPIADRSHHIFFPFFAGPDDKAALRLVLQLAESPDVTATLVHYDVSDDYFAAPETEIAPPSPTAISTSAKGATVVTTHATRDEGAAFFAALRASLPADLASRVVFETVKSTKPVEDVLARAAAECGQSPRNAGDLVVLGRNVGSGGLVLQRKRTEEGDAGAAGALGVLAHKVWEGKVGASVMVVKAGIGGE
jgi:hypothetical protein